MLLFNLEVVLVLVKLYFFQGGQVLLYNKFFWIKSFWMENFTWVSKLYTQQRAKMDVWERRIQGVLHPSEMRYLENLQYLQSNVKFQRCKKGLGGFDVWSNGSSFDPVRNKHLLRHLNNKILTLFTHYNLYITFLKTNG